MPRRVAWVALAGLVLFLSLSLGSYDSADAPSHLVAVHNTPAANLCGAAGAVIAHWTYHVVGFGAWVLVAAGAALLVPMATRRAVSHPVVRFLGLLLVTVGISSMHRLMVPAVGPLSGAPGGMLAEFIVTELTPRFSAVGTAVILLAGIALGAVVAVEQLVHAVPAVAGVTRRAAAATGASLAAMRIRPEAAPARRGRKSGKSGGSRSKRKKGADHIDPDAGGIGAVESFDPDDYEYEDEGDDEAYEYEDEAPDDEWEYEDEEDEEYEDDEEEEDVEEDDDTPDAADEPDRGKRPRLSEEELRAKIAKLPVRLSSSKTTIARDEDIPREESFEGYQFPTLELLEDPESNYSEKMEAFVRGQAEKLESALNTYGIEGEVVGIESGPVVTLYSIQLAPGTKVAKVQAVASDVARALGAINVRIVPNREGKTTVGIEVPNSRKEKVRLKELMSGGESEGMHLPMFLAKDVSGESLVADLTRMPHMLIAGTTGSGKSVCINTILMSWLYTKRPNELKLILVDPKMVELSQFADIPHLMCPVVTEMSRAAAILEWAVNKMEERYELLREAGVRDIGRYNQLTEEELYELFEPANDVERAKIPKRLPYIVFVIDELADLILMHKEVEQHIVRLAQKARAVGIHLILATQRPQANVVTGLIKSNMPCRASFKVASGMDSRIVLDAKGAELLLGQGDMLFLSPHSSDLRRAQGTLLTDTEIRKVVKFLREVAAPTFERSLVNLRPAGNDEMEIDGKITERDPLFDKAVEIMIESGRGSVSLIQRRLAIGYSRASRLVDQMAMAGIVGGHRGSVARDVLISSEEWKRMKALEEAEGQDAERFKNEEASDEFDDDADIDGSVDVETVSRKDAEVA